MDVRQELSSVRLELESQPSGVTLVRAMLSGVGERFELDPEFTDDLKTAVSEACNNVILHAYPGQSGPMAVEIDVDPEALRVTVIDHGVGIRQVAATEDRMGVGLAVISALADRAEFQSRAEGGTAVRMLFGARDRPFNIGFGGVEIDSRTVIPEPEGSVTMTVAPVTMLGDVLGRVARAIAAGAHFSLDRFSDLYLITDELAAHARFAAAGGRIACGISSESGRLKIFVGPFRRGTVDSLTNGDAQFSFIKLVNDLQVEPWDDGGEILRVLVIDSR